MFRKLLDLGGGVNGHDANLRDKCGVCDDVTGRTIFTVLSDLWGGVNYF